MRAMAWLAMAAALLVPSCASSDETESSDLKVRNLDEPGSQRVGAGRIYANDVEGPDEACCLTLFGSGREPLRNRCLFVWSDGTWTLAAETSPGFYNDVLDEGPISGWKDGGLGEVRGLPSDAFEGARSLTRTGTIEAWWHGEPVPQRAY